MSFYRYNYRYNDFCMRCTFRLISYRSTDKQLNYPTAQRLLNAATANLT